jgi:hypothetical protein
LNGDAPSSKQLIISILGVARQRCTATNSICTRPPGTTAADFQPPIHLASEPRFGASALFEKTVTPARIAQPISISPLPLLNKNRAMC